jgi:hypothetical protein
MNQQKRLPLTLILAATAADGLLAGASLDQSIKQLPARHRIGIRTYSRYSRAADLGNGIALYSILGIGAAALTIAAAVTTQRTEASAVQTRPLNLAAGLAILHTLVTTQAASTNFRQPAIDLNDTEALTHLFDRFERWQTVRVILQALNLGAMLWAIGARLRAER